MKQQFIKDLIPGKTVSDVFYLLSLNIKEKKDGGLFLTLELVDRTGSILGKIWDDIEVFQKRAIPGNFYWVQGLVREYLGTPEITINDLAPVDSKEVSRDDFIPKSRYDSQEMFNELLGYFSEIEENYLRRLLDRFFSNAEFCEEFKLCPGGARAHHAYLGGLLEHTLFMVRLAKLLSGIYQEVNRSLLLAGTILHDVGKTKEYIYEKAIDHTDDGRLIGHIVLGYEMVKKEIETIERFPRELKRMLLHMIISHHGQLDFGSPKTPKFAEAFILSSIDNLDARVMMFREVKAKFSDSQTKWTDYHQYLETNIYLPGPYRE